MSLRPSMKKVMAAVGVIRASRALARRRYWRAIELLRRVFGVFGSSEPSLATPLIANVLFAHASLQVGSNEAAYYACEVALRQCSAAEQKAQANRKDLDYLRFRCKSILSCLSPYRDSLAMKLAQSVAVSASDLALDEVSPILRRYFPTDRHWTHQVDGFLAQNREVSPAD